jgi:hypothetical protein
MHAGLLSYGGRRSVLALVAAAGMGVATTALAQPILIIHGLADDISANGTGATGLFFDADLLEYEIYRWQRGTGYTRVPGTGLSAEPIRGSSDLSVLATGKANTANWGDLNCFNGYCTFGDCTPGDPLPPLNPCPTPSIAHSWSAGTGWVNAGSIERVLDPVTGRFYGGTHCGTSINSVNDLSGNGRYMVGGAWSATLTGFGGGPSSGLCGDFVAFLADRTLGTISTLPVQPGTTTSRADSISNDGSVITGYDQGEIIDPEFGPYEGRRISVWTNGVQTLIDALSNAFSTYPVNGAGTVIVGDPAPAFNNATFGINDVQLVRWVRQPDNSWAPEALAKPADFFDGVETKPLLGFSPLAVSDDGNTIVGTASYGTGFFDRVSRAFIWNPAINEGVPMDLGLYLASVAPGSPIIEPGITLTAARAISADGNAITVSLTDARTTCDPQDLGLATGNHGVLYLNSSGIACDQPRIGLQPGGWVSTQYTSFGVALNVFASGTWPMTYQWQREDPQAPGSWINLSEACSGFPYGGEWDYEGANKNQLRVGQANCGGERDGRYRVVLTNPCGTVTSEPATVTFEQGTLITQQPTDARACRGSFVSMFAVAVSNSADLGSQWEVALASDPNNFTTLFDGTNILADGRTLEVFGATGQFLGMSPVRSPEPGSYIFRCQFLSPCGNATSDTATLTFCPADFNCDGFIDFFDYDSYVACFEGTECPNFDPLSADFNGDGFVDFFDYDAFVAAFEIGC